MGAVEDISGNGGVVFPVAPASSATAFQASGRAVVAGLLAGFSGSDLDGPPPQLFGSKEASPDINLKPRKILPW
jgi:hypothetical protein